MVFICFSTPAAIYPTILMNDVIENINNPEPKFMLHDEMIHWLQQNMAVNLSVNKEHIQNLVLPDGNTIPSDYEFANISVQITLNQMDVYKGAFPKTIYTNPVKLLIPKNDRAQWGGATEREMKIYNDLHTVTSRVNKLLEELQNLRGALQNVQYPLPEDLQ